MRQATSFRYERSAPSWECTRCGAPLWPGDVAAVVARDPDAPQVSTARRPPRVELRCWDCTPGAARRRDDADGTDDDAD